MKKVKLLFIIHGLSVGGAETFLVNLANALSMEFDITIISLSNNNPLIGKINNNIKIYIFDRKSKFDIKPVFRIREVVTGQDADILFCVGFFAYFIGIISTILLAKNIKRFLSYHTTFHRTRKEALMTYFMSFFIQKKDKIITVSQNQAIYTSKSFKIPIEVFKTIHNGVDIDFWKPRPDESIRNMIRDAFDIPQDAFVIIMTAAFREEKNHLGALEALAILNKISEKPVYLMLVGGGKLENDIKERITDLFLTQYVKLAGVQKDVRPFYWASDLFTLTSKSVETFSIAALEAMACGLPSVLTNIGGASEMIFTNLNGMLCDSSSNSIAETWYMVLTNKYDAKEIHNFISLNFNTKLMEERYRDIFLSK